MAEPKIKGLKLLRGGRGNAPTFECSNCKCKRYASCRCRLKKGKRREKSPIPDAA